MRAKIFISVFLFMGFGEALLTPKEIEARLQSLELAKSEFEVEIQTLELSNTKLNQEVNHLKTQVAELLEIKCESEMDEANQTLSDVQNQAEFHLVIAAGEPLNNATQTETFKWPNEDDSSCDLPHYPVEINGAVPVILEENYYGCGGYPWTAQCFNILNGEEAPFNLLHKRAGASSVTTNDTVFVLGGWTRSNDLASYETISTDFVQTEGVLPFTWSNGCSTLINSTTILLAGGRQDGTRTAKTWFFNFETEEWTQGPSMIEERYSFSCGLIKRINSLAAFGGMPPTATTEIVKLPGGSFKKADDLPFELAGMSTLPDPKDDNALVVSGGYDGTNGQFSGAILKLTCAMEEDCKWQVLSHKLQVSRYYHISFFTNKPLNCTN